MTLRLLTVGKRSWLIAAGVALSLAIIIGLFYAVTKVKKAARRIHHANNLKQIALALSNFQDTYTHLPPAVRKDKSGRPLCSWRFQILPFVQSWMGSPHMEFGEPWDSPANKYWADMAIRVYWWSSEEDSEEKLHTNVVAITGPGTPFEDDRRVRLKEVPGNTILLVEIAHSGIHWIAPGDLQLDSIPESLVQGLDGDGFLVLFADQQIWFLSADVPLEVVKKFFTIENAKKHDRDQILGPYALSRYGIN